jgi:hypothetical protein
MHIGDADLVERGGKLALGDARPREAATARVSTSKLTLARLSSPKTASDKTCS